MIPTSKTCSIQCLTLFSSFLPSPFQFYLWPTTALLEPFLRHLLPSSLPHSTSLDSTLNAWRPHQVNEKMILSCPQRVQYFKYPLSPFTQEVVCTQLTFSIALEVTGFLPSGNLVYNRKMDNCMTRWAKQAKGWGSEGGRGYKPWRSKGHTDNLGRGRKI